MQIDELLQPYADELVTAMVDLVVNKKYPPSARVAMARALLQYAALQRGDKQQTQTTIETVRTLLEQYE